MMPKGNPRRILLKTLPPQHLKENDWQDVEDQLKAIFYDTVFAPIVEVLRKSTPQAQELKELMNAPGTPQSLMLAIRSGRVQYADGIFSGDFSVAISKDLRGIGATFDHRTGIYRMPVGLVPPAVRAEAARYQDIARITHEQVQLKLDEIQRSLDLALDKKNIDATGTILQIEKGWKASARLLEVKPGLDPDRTQQLSDAYNKNLKLYIKTFSKESIYALREAVSKNAQQGFRFDKLTEIIRHRYGVSANKAKFLARQETGLFMAKYRRERLGQAGVQRYQWSTAHDERVRDSHKRLDGLIFSYDLPPITDRNTGAKNNPGEDYNCRCVDKPLLEYEGVIA